MSYPILQNLLVIAEWFLAQGVILYFLNLVFDLKSRYLNIQLYNGDKYFFRKRSRVETDNNETQIYQQENKSGQSSDANMPVAWIDATASFEIEALRSNRIFEPSMPITTNDRINDIGNKASGPCQPILSNFPKNCNIAHPRKTK